MAPAEWYVAKGKQRTGPFPLEHLKQLVATGQLAATDMLLQAGSTKWTKPEDVPGLIPVASSIAAEPTSTDSSVCSVRRHSSPEAVQVDPQSPPNYSAGTCLSSLRPRSITTLLRQRALWVGIAAGVTTMVVVTLIVAVAAYSIGRLQASAGDGPDKASAAVKAAEAALEQEKAGRIAAEQALAKLKADTDREIAAAHDALESEKAKVRQLKEEEAQAKRGATTQANRDPARTKELPRDSPPSSDESKKLPEIPGFDLRAIAGETLNLKVTSSDSGGKYYTVECTKKDGGARKFLIDMFPNGKPFSVEEFKDGRPVQAKSWWANGQQSTSIHYKGFQKAGAWEFWNRDGAIIGRVVYSAGRPTVDVWNKDAMMQMASINNYYADIVSAVVDSVRDP